MCITSSKCLAFTLTPKGSKQWWCEVFHKQTTPNYSFEPKKDARFFYTEDNEGTLEADGLFYFLLKVPTTMHAEANTSCQFYSNYNLALITSMRSFSISLKYCYKCDESDTPYTAVDMMYYRPDVVYGNMSKIPNELLHQAVELDGTNPRINGIGLKENKLKLIREFAQRYSLCQANYFGIIM